MAAAKLPPAEPDRQHGDMFAENTAHTENAEYQLLMRTLKRFVNAKTLGSLIPGALGRRG